jgi:hypothetical protein
MRICFLSESTVEKMQKVEKAEAYLRGIYPDWDRTKYIYKKG